MNHIILRLLIVVAFYLGMSFSNAYAADHWVYSTDTTNIYVVEETINWTDDYNCTVGIRTLQANGTNAAQNKARSSHFFYSDGTWYVSVMKQDAILVDSSPVQSAILSFILEYR